jgi:hypothetical protein
MDPVTLIIAALRIGTRVTQEGDASTSIMAAFSRLRTLVARSFEGRPIGELVLAEYESDPDLWEAPLRAELGKSGAAADPELASTARELFSLLEEIGLRGLQAGAYVISIYD